MERRSKALDCLRALAVFLVLGRHLFHSCPEESSRALHAITAVWARGGWVGVDLFFVLSGFLVSGLLFREHQKLGTVRAGRFLIRRGFKIYPAFWALILATILVKTLLHESIPPLKIISEFLFIQNYSPMSLWGHTWSLAVEEHFYLLLALFIFCLVKHHRGRPGMATNPFQSVPRSFLFVAVLCLALRLWTRYHVPSDDVVSLCKHLFPTHLRLDSLFFGVFISYYYHFHRQRFTAFVAPRRWWFCLAGIALLAGPFFQEQSFTPWMWVWGFTLYYLGSGLLLCGVLMLRLPANPLIRLAAYVGSHSYSIYLWHLPVSIVSESLARHSHLPRGEWFLYAAVYWIGSFVVGISMALAIEFPVLKLRNRWFPSEVGLPAKSKSDAPVLSPASTD